MVQSVTIARGNRFKWNMSKRYLNLPIDEALIAKWESGRKHYRDGDDGGFVGDPVEELFQELLDSIQYTREIERRGTYLHNFEKTFRDLAEQLQWLALNTGHSVH